MLTDSDDTLAQTCSCACLKSSIFKGRMSALPLNGGGGLPSASAAARSCFSFSNISLIGRCAAATHRFLRSLPEYPSVMLAIASRSMSQDNSSFANMTLRIFALLVASGKLTINLRGSLRMTASSRSKGLFVAASTNTRSVSFVRNPSQFTINSFFILRIASCSPGFSLRPNMLSTSSTNTTLGAILLASEKTAFTYFSPSPNHLDVMLDIEIFMKFAPASVATAFASIVFPVPGGPNKRMPLQGLVNCPLQKSSGLRKGSITNSFSVSFTFSRAPISSNVTPMSLGGITSPKSLFSNSFSVTTSLRDFFKLLDSFWIACSIVIPYLMLSVDSTSLVSESSLAFCIK
uniref:Uncharacterized protein n=1 Tax=Opuntia streptacantha TaxID=393608 RepID=A0A7C9DUR7_OPUST